MRITGAALAVLAIGILGYDYCDGHYDSSPFDADFCPYCASYMSTELTPVFSLNAWQPTQCAFYVAFECCDCPYHPKRLTHKVTRRGPPLCYV